MLHSLDAKEEGKSFFLQLGVLEFLENKEESTVAHHGIGQRTLVHIVTEYPMCQDEHLCTVYLKLLSGTACKYSCCDTATSSIFAKTDKIDLYDSKHPKIKFCNIFSTFQRRKQFGIDGLLRSLIPLLPALAPPPLPPNCTLLTLQCIAIQCKQCNVLNCNGNLTLWHFH